MQKINTENDYQNYISDLKKYAEHESVEDRQRHIAIINTKQEVLGIKMANIRKIANEIYKLGYDKFLEISLKKNYKKEFYEETLIQGLVIAKIKNLEQQIKYIDKWIIKIDNWATCDSFSCSLKILNKNVEKHKFFDYFYNLSFNDEEFISRVGITTIMNNYLENQYIDRIIYLCENLRNETYYSMMALAWLVSFMFIKFKDETYKLLQKKVMSKFVQNKAISKCRDSFQVSELDKEKLIDYRIK